MPSNDFVLVHVGHLSAREQRLFSAFSKASHEAALAQAGYLHPYRDAIPLLVATSKKLFPKSTDSQRGDMCEHVWATIVYAQRLVHHTAGSA